MNTTGTMMTSQLINPTVTEVDISVHTDSVLVRLQSYDRPSEVFGLRFTDGLTMAKFCAELYSEVMKQLKGAQDAEEARKVAGAGSSVGAMG